MDSALSPSDEYYNMAEKLMSVVSNFSSQIFIYWSAMVSEFQTDTDALFQYV
jgi:hypothetical protein